MLFGGPVTKNVHVKFQNDPNVFCLIMNVEVIFETGLNMDTREIYISIFIKLILSQLFHNYCFYEDIIAISKRTITIKISRFHLLT